MFVLQKQFGGPLICISKSKREKAMKNLPTNEIMMSITEIAQLFNVDESTVRRYIGKVFPEKIKNGVKTLLDENEVTAVKLKLQQNQYLVRPADLPKTDLFNQK